MEKLKSIQLSSWIISTSAAAVLSFFLWAEWAEIDQLTRAMGKVIPVDKVQVIQTADGGVVEEMRVREGDAVRKGQLLVRIDRVKVQAAVGESQAKVAAFRSIMSRIEAELYDRPLNFPAELRSYPDFIANQTALFTKRRQAISSEIAALEAVKRLMQQELELNIPLVSSGDVARA
jgi:adhesin transport system membrane fusion protein